jgi:tRNA G37 N-methylase Trm5
VYRAGARKVYACEWNPHAITALRHNLLINGVEKQCIVIEGDNRLTAPQATAGLFVLLVNMFSGLVSSPAVKKSQLVFRVLG